MRHGRWWVGFPIVFSIVVFAASAEPAYADGNNGLTAVPFVFDPGGTHLVSSEWEDGVGCPTAARTYGTPYPTYTDPACATGDMKDRRNEGLVLVKTGPTANVASAGASIKGFKSQPITELGYDIRKPGSSLDARGSHCGAGAPRFNLTTQDGSTYFIGCNSPPADAQMPGLGWVRLRWGGSVPLMAFGPSGTLVDITPLQIKTIEIVFDEGQDTGPDNFGLAVLDNIDINGTLVGEGPNGPADGGRDEGHGEDKDHRHYDFHDNQQRPESS